MLRRAEQLVAEAKMLEKAGASLLDFQNSGPIVGPAVVAAVSLPVIGGFGGGPWLDGRVRLVSVSVDPADRNMTGGALSARAQVRRKIALRLFAGIVTVSASVRPCSLASARTSPRSRMPHSGFCPRSHASNS